MINNLDNHNDRNAMDKAMRAGLDALTDAEIYYKQDASDHNLHLLRRAKYHLLILEEEQSNAFDDLDEEDTQSPRERY